MIEEQFAILILSGIIMKAYPKLYKKIAAQTY